VRLALEEHHILPGDPGRVFNTFDSQSGSAPSGAATRVPEHEPAAPRDPTTIKPHESNPFTGE
jgi:hypothetical protein